MIIDLVFLVYIVSSDSCKIFVDVKSEYISFSYLIQLRDWQKAVDITQLKIVNHYTDI